MRVTLASIGLLFTPISSGHAWTAGQPLTSAASDVAPRRRHLSPAAVGDGRHLGGRRIGRGGGLEMTIDLDSPIVKSLIPKLGVVTSTALYFSPLMAVLNAKMSGDIGDLNPIPLTIMAISSVCWLAYGLSIQDPYVTISNVPGAVATIWYIVGVLSPWSCRLWTLLIRASLVITGFDTASAGEQSTGDCAEDTCDIVSGDDQPLDISLVDQKTFGRDPTLSW